MVAVIRFSASLRNVLNYNENKLKLHLPADPADENKTIQKKATFLHAVNYGKDTGQLTFNDRFKVLEKYMSLREERKKSVTHISLNFDPSEKASLDAEKLKAVADAYMQKIGFGNQPYLVYQHHDAGHPHIHIVSTIIRRDGTPIETHNIGRTHSEQARLAIEKEFALVHADHHRQQEIIKVKPVNAQKVSYGRSETKRAITNVLDHVLPRYKYTSLAELNAVLQSYNVLADQGSEDSRTYKNNGLVYRILDADGHKVGVPIKASDIYNNPGLKFLCQQFERNEPLRQPFKKRIRNAIDLTINIRKTASVQELQQALQKEKIELVIRKNKEGVIYGMTYVDHLHRCVFNGSDLGKPYSSNAIKQRLQSLPQPVAPAQKQTAQSMEDIPAGKPGKPAGRVGRDNATALHPQNEAAPANSSNLLYELLKPEQAQESLPGQLKKQKRKRKKKRLHL